MSDNTAASEAGAKVHDRVRKMVQAVLRAAQAANWTDDMLASATGIPARTIKSYRTEGKEPSIGNVLILCDVLGPDAMNAILAAIGWGGAHPLDEATGINVAKLVADLLPHISTIAQAAADGRIDHTEEPACRDAADHIIATVIPLSSAAGVGKEKNT